MESLRRGLGTSGKIYENSEKTIEICFLFYRFEFTVVPNVVRSEDLNLLKDSI